MEQSLCPVLTAQHTTIHIQFLSAGLCLMNLFSSSSSEYTPMFMVIHTSETTFPWLVYLKNICHLWVLATLWELCAGTNISPLSVSHQLSVSVAQATGITSVFYISMCEYQSKHGCLCSAQLGTQVYQIHQLQEYSLMCISLGDNELKNRVRKPIKWHDREFRCVKT